MTNVLRTALPLIAFVLLGLNMNAQSTPFNDQMTVVWPAHTVTNPCNGDIVDFPDTDYHVSVHGVIKANGTMNFHGHINANLQGVTQGSGVIYNCITTDNFHHNGIANGSITETFNQHLVSQGGGSNFWFNGVIALHINANGDVVVDSGGPVGTGTCSGN